MSKTYDLRVIVKRLLDQVTGNTYYEEAPDTSVYPYKIFEFENIGTQDTNRDDSILVVHVWGRDIKQVELICDRIENLFQLCNNPTSTSLPTFYAFDRRPIPDEDKTLKHRQIKIQVQNYYIGA